MTRTKIEPEPHPYDPTVWTHWHDLFGVEFHVGDVVAVAMYDGRRPALCVLEVETILRLTAEGEPIKSTDAPTYGLPSAHIVGRWLKKSTTVGGWVGDVATIKRPEFLILKPNYDRG